MSLTEETLWSQYEDLGVIGTGAYSSVRKARHRSTGATVAIKVLEKRRRIRAVLQEVEIMKMLAHPNTVSLFQIVDTKDNVYLVLEFCQNELLEHISMKGCLQEDEARRMFRQIIDAIFYCHSLGIVHQDIKPDNIMVDDGGKVTVIDFGLASRFWPGQMLRKFCGTYKYMPPEAISFEAYDGPKKDMWSLGVLLYYMVTGTIPFNSDVRGKLCLKIITGDYKLPEGLSAELKDLIRQLLTVDPKRRPTTQIRTHPWLQQGQGGSDNPKPLPRELDRNIISAMGFMKFNEDNILKAIQKNKYDEIMATYLILQSQKQDTMRQKAEDKPVWPGSTPFPSTSEPAAFPMPPKRKHPEPGFRTLSLGLSASEQPEDRQRAEHEEFSSASLPDLYTSRPEKRTTAKPRPERARPYTAAASLCPGPGPQLPQKAGPVTKDRRPKAPQHTISPKAKERKLAASTQGSQEPGRWLELPQPTASTAEGDTEPASRGLRSCLKALRGRIQSCLSRTFHRRPAWTRHLFQKRVSPQQAVDISADDDDPVTPEDTTLCIPCMRGRRGKIRPS